MRLFVILLLCLGVFQVSKQIYSYFSEEARFALELDEAFVVEPARRVMDKGYFGYRCSQDLIATCYGSTQVFLDGLLLKLFPEGDKLLLPQTLRWFWLSEDSGSLLALRLSRVVYGIVLALLLYWLTKDFGILPIAVLATNASFLSAYQGSKNDWAMAFWTLVLLVSYQARSKILQAAVSVLALGVKITVLPLVVFQWVRSIAIDWKQKKLKALLSAIGTLSFAVALYLILNPNTFISYSEATWFMNLVRIKNHPFSWEYVIPETWVMFRSTWMFWALIALGIYHRRSERLRNWVIENSSGLLFCTAILFLNWKSQYLRYHYYLPVVVTSLYLGARLLRALNLNFLETKRAWLFLFFGFAMQGIAKPPEFLSFQYTRADVDQLMAATESERIWVDDNLKLPISTHFENRVRYFNSITDSLESLQANPEDAVWVTCWSKTDFPMSPAAEDWLGRTSAECTQFTPFEEATSIRWGYPWPRKIEFVNLKINKLGAPEFPKLAQEEIPVGYLYSDGLQDHRLFKWGGELKTMPLRFLPKQPVKKIELTVWSNCRENVTVSWSDLLTNASTNWSLSVQHKNPESSDWDEICRYSHYCKFQWLGLSQKWWELGEWWTLEFASADQWNQIHQELNLSVPDSCRVFFKPLRFLTD